MPRVKLTLLLALCALLAGCSKVALLHQQESFVFGTRVEILIAGLDEAKARPAAAAVLREFDRLHRTYHAWQPSELSDLNAAIADGIPLPVSHEMARLIAEAQMLSRLGGGLFDPGIGGLIRLWGFQSDEFKAALPDEQALAEWKARRPSIADLRIDEDTRTVSSAKPQVSLDFGGYLKGVALDNAVSILRSAGVNNALINIGGNVMALGTKNGTPWRIGIQHPRKPGPLATLELREGEAIGTSGDYQRFFELGGKRYCHLLDPSSGLPVTHTQSLTVLVSAEQNARARPGTLSDIASKPLFIAGPAWPQWAEKLGIHAVMRVDTQGHIQVSAALRQRLTFVDVAADLIETIP